MLHQRVTRSQGFKAMYCLHLQGLICPRKHSNPCRWTHYITSKCWDHMMQCHIPDVWNPQNVLKLTNSDKLLLQHTEWKNWKCANCISLPFLFIPPLPFPTHWNSANPTTGIRQNDIICWFAIFLWNFPQMIQTAQCIFNNTFSLLICGSLSLWFEEVVCIYSALLIKSQ